MRCAMTCIATEPLHMLTNEDKIICGKDLVAFAIVNVVGITPVCKDCETKLQETCREYHTDIIPNSNLIWLYEKRYGKPYQGGIAYRVIRWVHSRHSSHVYKTTGTIYRSQDPHKHPNDFEQAFEEIERIAAK